MPGASINIMGSPHKKRHFSFKGADRRVSVNVQVDCVFMAVERRSLEQLQESLVGAEGCVNGHGGPFYVTPLHAAVEAGWVEGVRELLQHGASVCARNQYDQTPLHYACAAKQHEIVALLLDSGGSSSAINLHDMRGMSPLHEGAASGSLQVVKLLLINGAAPKVVDKQGESPLHKAAKCGAFDVMVALMEEGADLCQKDYRGICALRWLQMTIPNGLERLFDHLLITNATGSQQSPVTFNFSAFVNDCGTQQCQLLSYFVETNNAEILTHPVCHVFLLIKWRRARLVFLGYLLYFVAHALLTGFCIFLRQLYIPTPDEGSLRSKSQNSSTPDTSNCDDVRSRLQTHLWMEVCLCVTTLLLLVTQLDRLRIQGLTYVKVPSFWIQLASVALTLTLLAASWCQGHGVVAAWEPHVATIVLLLLQLQFLLILRKYPSHGLYVAMFIRVAEDFLRIFFVYCTLLMCFTVTLFLIFNTGIQTQSVYCRWPLLFLKSLTMMLGSVDVNQKIVYELDRLPYTSYLVILLFILLISIVLSNLLVALAVSDIRELRASAHLTRLTSMVEATVTMEQLCDLPLLRRLAGYCKLDPCTTQVRLWPQHDVRHPSVVVEVRKLESASPMWPRYCSWLRGLMHPGRYQVNIPATLQREVMRRLNARKRGAGQEKTTSTSAPTPLSPDHMYHQILAKLTAIELALNNI